MSIHRSLRVKGTHVRQRNVLTRIERLQELTKSERWREGDSVFALPKVKVARIRKAVKKAKAEEVKEGEAAEAASEKPAETAAKAPAKTAGKTSAKK